MGKVYVSSDSTNFSRMFTLESLGKKMHSFTERDYTLLLLHQLSSSLILPYLPWNQLRYFFLCNTIIIDNKYMNERKNSLNSMIYMFKNYISNSGKNSNKS